MAKTTKRRSKRPGTAQSTRRKVRGGGKQTASVQAKAQTAQKKTSGIPTPHKKGQSSRLELRQYQLEAIAAVNEAWEKSDRGEERDEETVSESGKKARAGAALICLPTGTGKTVVFCNIAKEAKKKGKVLILAHRDELIRQAADKYTDITGEDCGIEKGPESDITPPSVPHDIVVASVQTLMRDERLHRYPEGYFSTIIIDEAHHAAADSYQKILNYFPDAKILGVTATPGRNDKKDLSETFGSITYEYELRTAIEEKYLCPIKVKTIGLKLDMTNVRSSLGGRGDYDAGSTAEMLTPHLMAIAQKIRENASNRKTVIFLPTIDLSENFTRILNSTGIETKCISNKTPLDERQDTLNWIKNAPKGTAICNAMILTEGWDCPNVDCVVILRPTKFLSLYTQMVGRGTRPSPGKKDLLLLDFLWLSKKHNVCRPASLTSDNAELVDAVSQEAMGKEVDLFATSDSVKERKRDEAMRLAAALSQYRDQGEREFDLLDESESLVGKLLQGYKPQKLWEYQDITGPQSEQLISLGIDPTGYSRGEASYLISWGMKRREKKLCTVKQFELLRKNGIKAYNMSKEEATKRIGEITQKIPPTEKQINALIYYGVRPDIATSLSKEKATRLISIRKTCGYLDSKQIEFVMKATYREWKEYQEQLAGSGSGTTYNRSSYRGNWRRT